MRYVDALLCVAVLLLAEWLAVGALSARELAGPYELALTLATLVPLAMVAAAPLAFGGVLIRAGLADPTSTRGRASVAVPAAVLTALVAVGVSGGRLLAGTRRPVFVAGAIVLSALLAWFGTPPAARLIERLRRAGKGRWIAAVAALLLLLELCNARVLPRLYPMFHLGMAVLTLWVAALASMSWTREARRRTRLGLAAAVAMVSIAFAIGAPTRMRLYDNIRLIYLERAPLLSHAVRLAALIAPPPPLSGQAPPEPGPATPRHIDFGGRDILLVTIDALRADHVGAYGYARATTPALDALAKDGVVFEAAYTATPHTSYAVTSLMTGKYMRPLLRQGVGADSETWAQLLRRYGYQTAAFYPPAAFFVDREHFEHFERSGLGFEYRKVQFASAASRIVELEAFLEAQSSDQPLFVWVHLFEPHEPYEPSAEPFGKRSIDLYDAEILDADRGLDGLVRAVRRARPRALVMVSADHGEEFGEHGGRYHGTTVYDEQVRVPLVINAPGLLEPRRVSAPVSLVDLLPTTLRGLGIPVSPRIRGRDLGALLVGEGARDAGFAFAETDDQTLLATAGLRLICERRLGACRLYDTTSDPQQRRDVSADHVRELRDMKQQLGGLVSSLGRYEGGDVAWPRDLRRGIAGDVDAASDVAALLDDADVRIRRKAAEVLFALRREDVAVHLRHALRRDEDGEVRRWCALALTRLGQGAPLTFDLLDGDDRDAARLAALVLAEAGDARGELTLIRWWRSAYPEDPKDAREVLAFERAKEVALALGRIKSKDAIGPLTWGLRDVRLRRFVARALADIGHDAARPALARALADERYHDARLALADALLTLGAEAELRQPLTRYMGTPDPLERGLDIALKADVLRYVGGPRDRELRRLRDFAQSGVTVGLVIPEDKHVSGEGLRVLVLARTRDDNAGEVRVGLRVGGPMSDGDRSQQVPKATTGFDAALTVTIAVPPSEALRQLYRPLPAEVAARVGPGDHADFVVYTTQNVELRALAVVALTTDVPAPAPEPWQGD